jgi:hypothetical protein
MSILTSSWPWWGLRRRQRFVVLNCLKAFKLWLQLIHVLSTFGGRHCSFWL